MDGPKTTYIGDMDGLMTVCHDMSMEVHPGASCFGRLTKHMTPAFISWLETEMMRGTDFVIIMSVLTQWFASMGVTVTANMVPDRKAAMECVDIFREKFNEHIGGKMLEMIDLGVFEKSDKMVIPR